MLTQTKITLQDVKSKQPEWFSRKNKKFFGDVSYKLLYSKSGKPFLIRSTYAWSDSFGGKKTLFYAINPIKEDLDIDHFVTNPNSYLHKEFKDMNEVKNWLKEN